MKDIVICSMPALIVDRVPGAPAILKGAVEKAGFTAATIDLSLEFFVNQCYSNIDRHNRLSCIFRSSEPFDEPSLNAANEWLKESIDSIKAFNPKLVGLSVFSAFQHRSTYLLAKELRKSMPDVKIVLGGLGLPLTNVSLSYFDIPLKKIDLLKPYHQYMTEQGLADYVVLGSGLDDLIRILEKEVGVDSPLEEEFNNTGVVFKTPIPNYDDYKMDKYIWNDGTSLPVTGSKGCVRACTFCDIPGQHGRFSFRTGQDIADEMIFLKEKYGITIFEFTDSLVNGSFKAFRQWLTILADYNDQQTEDQKIRWFGQYICRPQSQTPSDIYPLMARSGVTNLVIGVESGSDAVLEAMKKKMVIQDVFDELEMFKKYNIKCTFLMFAGFYNETYERYLETLKFLIDIQPYVASGTISKLSLGEPLRVHSGTYLYNEADHLGLVLNPYDASLWTSKDNPENDYVQRASTRLTTQILNDALGYPIAGNSIATLHLILRKLIKLESELEKELNALTPLSAN